MGKVKVLHVISSCDRRGGQVSAVDLAGELSRLYPHWESSVVALSQGNSTLPLQVTVLGRSSRNLQTIFRLRRAMSNSDITIAHGSSTGLACWLASFCGNCYIFRQISSTGYWANTRSKRFRVRRYLSRAVGVVALNDADRGDLIELIGLDPGNIQVIPNGVKVPNPELAFSYDKVMVRRILGIRKGACVVLFAGALVKEKGLADLIDCVGKLPMTHLLVAGDGPLEKSFIELCSPFSDRVTFLGPIEQMDFVYSVADIVSLPSYTELMPGVLIEAGIRGIPVVSTKVGGIPEIVQDQITGLLVDCGSVTDLIASMNRLIENSELRLSMGVAASKLCRDKFALDTVAAQWNYYLQEINSRECRKFLRRKERDFGDG